MACMGPNMDHAGPMADQFVEAIIVCLKDRNIERPDRCIFRLDRKWDAQVEIIRKAIKELVELDACDKF